MPSPRPPINRSSSPGAKELSEHLGALLLAGPVHEFASVIQPPVLRKTSQGATGSELGISGRLDDSAHPGVQKRPGAHETGLEGHEDLGAREPALAGASEGLPQRDHLGVRGRVRQFGASIARLTQDASIANDHTTDRDLTPLRRVPREFERATHPSLVRR